MVHGSRQADGAGVVREGTHHVKVARDRTHEVQTQVAQGHQGVAEETKTLADLDESSLVIFSLLCRKI